MSTKALDTEALRSILDTVTDPEIPVLTIADLGILRSVDVEGEKVVVTINPTYSGCPAMGQIEDDIRAVLAREGVGDVEVRTAYSPAWSTDLITPEGRAKLEAFGIAPPVAEEEIFCPRCRASEPRMVARFGSTACKALMVCESCREPFDYFKELK
ncbi:MAG: 1,2-phenylacetyl-CoA epoxidase subunit PaaD [Acidimicrobiia bacterium]